MISWFYYKLANNRTTPYEEGKIQLGYRPIFVLVREIQPHLRSKAVAAD